MTLPPHVTDWPEPWRTVFEERAAIMEYLGGLGRSVSTIRSAVVGETWASVPGEVR